MALHLLRARRRHRTETCMGPPKATALGQPSTCTRHLQEPSARSTSSVDWLARLHSSRAPTDLCTEQPPMAVGRIAAVSSKCLLRESSSNPLLFSVPPAERAQTQGHYYKHPMATSTALRNRADCAMAGPFLR